MLHPLTPMQIQLKGKGIKLHDLFFPVCETGCSVIYFIAWSDNRPASWVCVWLHYFSFFYFGSAHKMDHLFCSAARSDRRELWFRCRSADPPFFFISKVQMGNLVQMSAGKKDGCSVQGSRRQPQILLSSAAASNGSVLRFQWFSLHLVCHTLYLNFFTKEGVCDRKHAGRVTKLPAPPHSDASAVDD